MKGLPRIVSQWSRPRLRLAGSWRQTHTRASQTLQTSRAINFTRSGGIQELKPAELAPSRDRSVTPTTSPQRLIDLEQSYDNVLRQIVEENLDTLETHFGLKNSARNVESPAWTQDEVESVDLLSSLMIETSEHGKETRTERVLRAGFHDLSRNYHSVMASRSRVGRMSCSTSLYNEFVRQLYPKHGLPSVPRLYSAYRNLPYPSPRYIIGQHLEDLVSFLMGAADAHPGVYLSILGDMSECSMPISVREHAAALQIAGSWSSSNLDPTRAEANWQMLDERISAIAESEPDGIIKDIGVLNILLGMSLGSNKLTHVLDNVMNRLDIGSELVSGDEPGSDPVKRTKADRFTVAAFLLYHGTRGSGLTVRSIYNNLPNLYFIVDTSILNLVMRGFLTHGFVQEAETVFRRVTSLPWQLDDGKYPGRRNFSMQRKLRKKVLVMDRLLQLCQRKGSAYSVPVVADIYTFATFFNFYSSRGEFSKAIGVLRMMAQQGCVPDRHFFFTLYSAFVDHGSSGDEEWSVSRLDYVTELVCDYEQQNIQHYCTATMAHKALAAYRHLAPECIPRIDELELKLFSKGQRPPFFKVYKLLKQLIEACH